MLEIFLRMKEENCYKQISVSNFWSTNYIEYNTLSVAECRNKIRPYLKDVINNFKKSDARKIYWTISINFISSTDNDEECAIH